ncbi:hypothetical protein LX64_01645 [Chitinophaga skermanii]|uniref:Uncharacterized protein n=1 Tax=Chitinophaga skermanii TaxID=331697 RepID=A0A327QR56_9BACT|nr:hypothetical protein [Chitinophaga skermanii]RAJ06518.1 hypothetical protein LX64_01645 [Chitinophaga skermanii]
MIINTPTPYPSFVKGQQLKSDHLNGIVTFAKNESRDTRTYLLGSGIFYGLEVSWDEAEQALVLSPGAGVTSDGYLFSIEEKKYYYSVKTSVGNNYHTISVNNRKVRGRILEEIKDANNADASQQALKRYIKGVDDTGATDTGKYFILLLITESESTKDSCMYGNDRRESIKTNEVELVLVKEKEDDPANDYKDAITEAELAQLMETSKPVNIQDLPMVGRFGLTKEETGEDGFAFWEFTQGSNIINNFVTIFNNAIPLIENAYITAYNALAPILGKPQNNPFTGMGNKLKATYAAFDGKPQSIVLYPYFYDYLRDLVSAFEELNNHSVVDIFSLMPNKNRFPGYLLLGSIRTTANNSSINYRMKLYRPPLADLTGNSAEQMSFLLDKMAYIANVDHVVFNAESIIGENLHMTPDAGINEELSERSIPFYYKNIDEVREQWNFTRTKTNRSATIPGVKNEDDQKFLVANINKYDFFRVKGHIGKPLDEVVMDLDKYRKRFHLPFDIKTVYVGDEHLINELVYQMGASFSDLAMHLDNVAEDMRCNGVCGGMLEERIFGQYDHQQHPAMFENLLYFFGSTEIDDINSWAEERCSEQDTCDEESRQCCVGIICTLYPIAKEYQERKQKLVERIFFHKFAETHPGFEHQGGVERGGTLVLVGMQSNVQDLSKERLEGIVNKMGASESGKAGTYSIKELLGYDVIADFCLPYQCCDELPPIKIEVTPLPPVAQYEFAGYEHGQEVYKVALNNNSLRADSFYWEIFDTYGQSVATLTTTDVNEQAVFELQYYMGAWFECELKASRDGIVSVYKDHFVLCPGSEVLLHGEADEKELTGQPLEEIHFTLEALPFGGEFILSSVDDKKVIEPNSGMYDISWTTDRSLAVLRMYTPAVGEYKLTYSFAHLNKCEKREDSVAIYIGKGRVVKDDSVKEEVNIQAHDFYKPAMALVQAANAPVLKEKQADLDIFFKTASGTKELPSSFEGFMDTLEPLIAESKTAQKSNLLQLLAVGTAHFIEGMVIASPEKATVAGQNRVTRADSIFKAHKASTTWKKIWTTEITDPMVSLGAFETYNSLIG